MCICVCVREEGESLREAAEIDMTKQTKNSTQRASVRMFVINFCTLYLLYCKTIILDSIQAKLH